MGLRNLTAATWLALGIAVAAQGQGTSLPPEYEPTIDELGSNLDQAEALMRAHQGVWLAKLDLMLFLHSFRDASPERDAEIDGLSQLIATEAWNQIPEESFARMPGKPPAYDGTSESLIPTVQLASLSALAINPATASYLIPCAILLKKPDLLAATGVMFGSGMDNFTPRSGCEWGRGDIKNFPEAAVDRFRWLADVADTIYLTPMSGSAKYGMAKRQSYVIERIKLKKVSISEDEGQDSKINSPYKSWGYLSLYNYNTNKKIDAAYNEAINELSRYYGVETPAARKQIAVALRGVALGACPSAPSGESLREALLDGAEKGVIEEKLAVITDPAGVEASDILNCATEAGIDPIMHIAVARPDILPLVAVHPIVGGIDTRNSFGKTPLMSAAQFDLLPAVIWLLANKADVMAMTDATEEWDYIKHGQRTALHYAAANASLPVIEALLAAGADPAAKDDEGVTPLDYLNGKGPVPANSRLSGAELDRARALLSKP